MIDGVAVKKLRVIPDGRGRLMELLRSDEEMFEKFGQVYITVVNPGVVKGWHYHKKQTDHIACISGMMKLVLYDTREKSPTYGQVNEFYCGIHSPVLVKIPPLVAHGMMCIGSVETIAMNVPTELYNYTEPDEFRIAPHSGEIPYEWTVKDG
ncbi:MAG: dTDP-4-dehydrorhamnose 3,5-epimerase family protein [Candidatus Omnitrophica bacterium]|nr:dTDP-4-dehydrorhamnose 3,5-epimerase family protein [Candidatus Omnitrophota bacterium]